MCKHTVNKYTHGKYILLYFLHGYMLTYISTHAYTLCKLIRIYIHLAIESY